MQLWKRQRGWQPSLRVVLLGALLVAGACSKTTDPQAPAHDKAEPASSGEPPKSAENEAMLKIESSAFRHEGEIPRQYTCEGSDIAPPLAWSGVPEGARSLALIVDDPDAPDPKAPKRTWVHWVLYNLPPTSTGLSEGGAPLPDGALDGVNDWKRTGYGGPCPPIGRHRYFHKLYALGVTLPDLGRPTKADLEKAMAGHILARAELLGTYQKMAR